MTNGPRTKSGLGARARQLVPSPVRQVATRLASERRAAGVQRELEALAKGTGPIIVGPWFGEVGFELLYWVPFVRWFAERYGVSPERMIVVSRGGAAAAWYGTLAARSYDVLAFMSPQEFKRRNQDRGDALGEQKQAVRTALDDEVVALVRQADGRDSVVLHPSLMYRLYGPYWWGHRPVEWVRRYMRPRRMQPPRLGVELPARYTAVKFYFNDCFTDTANNRAFVERTIRTLAEQGPVISLSTGVSMDDHDPCEPDVAAIQGIRHLLTPENNLVVQSAVVAGASRFVGTYGGFAYLAPLCGVPASSYYSESGSFSMRHLDLVRDVLRTEGQPALLDVHDMAAGRGV